MNITRIIEKDIRKAKSGNTYYLDVYFDGDRTLPKIEMALFTKIHSPKWYNREHYAYESIWTDDFMLEEDKLTNRANKVFSSIEEAIIDTVEGADVHLLSRIAKEQKSIDIINNFLSLRTETVPDDTKFEETKCRKE